MSGANISLGGTLTVTGVLTTGSSTVAVTNSTGNLQVSGFAAASLTNPAGTKLATSAGALVSGDVASWDASGNVIDGAIALADVALLSGTQSFTAVNTFTAAPIVAVDDSATNTTVNLFTLRHTSTGTPAASFGGALLLQLEAASGGTQDAGRFRVVWTDATLATRTSQATIQTVTSAGTLTSAATFTTTAASVPGTFLASGASVTVGAASTTTGSLILFNSAGSTSTTLSAGNAASTLKYILPAADPTASQVLSASAPSSGNVTLSWQSAVSLITLTSTQIAFGNGSNQITGSAEFTYSTSTGTLALTKNQSAVTALSVQNQSNNTAASAGVACASNAGYVDIRAYSTTATNAAKVIFLASTGISLPIASDISVGAQCAGVGANQSGSTSGFAGAVIGDSPNDRALFGFTAGDTNAHGWSVTFTYLIQ